MHLQGVKIHKDSPLDSISILISVYTSITAYMYNDIAIDSRHGGYFMPYLFSLHNNIYFLFDHYFNQEVRTTC
jgi:hypothetical protein